MKRSLPLVFGILLLLFGMSAGQQAPGLASTTSATAGNDEQIVAQLFAGWNSHDADKLAAVFSEDAVYQDMADGSTHRGKAEIRKWAVGAFTVFSDFKIEVVSTDIHNGRGTAEWIWSGTDKGLFKTGKKFSVRGVSIIEVRAGKVVAYKEYYDFATVLRQLGLMPADPK